MSSLSPSPKFRGVDTTTGLALVSGKLYTYSAGTLTPKNTYTSSTLGTPNANPTILDARGEADVWLDGAYKFILKDSLDNTIWTVDNITDPTNGATFTNATFAGTTALVNLTVSGTTALGDAQADTVSISGAVWKNGSGNYTFAAPSSGDAVTITAVSGSPALTLNDGGGQILAHMNSTHASGGFIRFQRGGVNKNFIGDAAGVLAGTVDEFAIRSESALKFGTGGNNLRYTISSAGNHTLAAPSSGTTVTINGLTGGVGLSYVGDAVTTALFTSAGGPQSFCGTTSNHAFNITTNSVVRTTWAAGGALTHSATSGVSFTGTGVAGSDAFVYNGGTSGSFRVNTTGVPYGTSLHNNAGAVTGTTNQYIASGTYTPTLTNTTNIAASTSGVCSWMRVGNVVTVSGQISIDPTAASTATQIGVSLPIASNLAAGGDCCGVAVRNGDLTAQQITGALFADTANDRASIVFFCDTDAANRVWEFHFTYVIL